MRTSLLSFVSLLAGTWAYSQVLPFADAVTGRWGLRDGEQEIAAQYDSVTVFGWNYAQTFFLWQDGHAQAAGLIEQEGRLGLLSAMTFDRVAYDAKGGLCLVRAVGSATYSLLHPDARRADGKPFIFPLPPIQDYKVYNENVWLKTEKGQAIVNESCFYAQRIEWLREIRHTPCPEGKEDDLFIMEDHRGRFAIGAWDFMSEFDIVDYVSLGDPCYGHVYWVTLRDGTNGICYPTTPLEPRGVKGLLPDMAAAKLDAFGLIGVIPMYRQDAQFRRWYGCMTEDLEPGAAIFPLELLQASLKKWGQVPSTEMLDAKFEPGEAFTLKNNGELFGCIVTDARGKSSYLYLGAEAYLYKTAFPVHAVAEEQRAYWAEWGQLIVGSRQGKATRYGVLNVEGYTVLPPVYDSIEFIPTSDATWAYAATRAGVRTLHSQDGEILEADGE
jgi:hypothetical protein